MKNALRDPLYLPIVVLGLRAERCGGARKLGKFLSACEKGELAFPAESQ